MTPESLSDEFSKQALFPELTEAQGLGFFTASRLDLGATYPEALAMLARLDEETSPWIDSEGYGWQIVHSQKDDQASRLAWVEWRMRECATYEDHAYFLKARDTSGKLRVWEIETVNPCFGCTVQSLNWQDEDVILVYADKHDTWEARLAPDATVLRQEASGDKVSCQLRPADIQAVHEALYRPAWGARHWGRYEAWRRVLAAITLTGFVMMLLKLFATNKLGADIVGWDVVGGAMLGGAGLGLWWARQNTTVPPPDSPVYQPFTLALDARGFRLRGEGFDNHTAWSQVSSLRQAGAYLLIDTHVGGTHIVPRAAFASPEAADAFQVRADSLRAGSH